MRNASGGWCCTRAAPLLQQVLAPPAASHGFGGLRLLLAGGMEVGDGVTRPPVVLRALASLNLHLLVAYLLLVVLAKVIARLHTRADATNSSASLDHGCDDNDREEIVEAEEDVVGGRQADTLFWFDEAVFEDTAALLADEGKDLLPYAPATATLRCLQVVEGTAFRAEESARVSPRDLDHHRIASEQQQETPKQREEAKDVAVDVVPAPEQRSVPVVTFCEEIPVVTSRENVSVGAAAAENGVSREEEEEEEEEEEIRCDAEDEHANETEGSFPDAKLFVSSRALADTRKLLLEGVVASGGGKLLQDEKDRDSSRFGASTLTSESTSKSSVEWQGSTATRDSEAEYCPFSSSSRRSSARWESYALFRKYDEDMVYFHRVGAQKLTETESFRSITHQPRSVSERIAHRLTPTPKPKPIGIGLRDPYPDLERAYVAQVCLTWEALNWNYTSFRRHHGGLLQCCPARVAQEFQQFQVLLHRFIENEPYECGRRPEVYARVKNSTPKLLIVPEFREEEDEKDDLISAAQFLLILEDSIRTFMTFLRADKRSHYEMFRDVVKRRSPSAGDQSLVTTLQKANKKKKRRLKDLARPRRCLKRTKLREEELPVLLGLIDLKVVARVLRVPGLTDQQLHWCEEKMNRVRLDLDAGRMQRDASLLFFPAH